MTEKMTEKKNKEQEDCFESKSAWESLSATAEKKLNDRCNEYATFLDLCRTERETIDHVEKIAIEKGFKKIADFGKGKKLKAGSKVYFINNNKAMGLAIIGSKHSDDGFRLIASHHDVPRLDIKPTPLYVKHDLSLLKTHYYGGVKKYHWVATPLALHGFVITKSGKPVNFRIGDDPKDPVFTITDLAPHVAKNLQENRKCHNLFEGEELNLVIGNKPKKAKKQDDSKTPDRIKKLVVEHLKKQTGFDLEDLAWGQMHVVPAIATRDVGIDRSMIGGYGHDDRACVAGSLQALLEIEKPKHTAVIMFLDKEEIGSCGPNGATSMMVQDLFGMLTEATSGLKGFADIRRAMSATLVISADTSPPIDPSFESTHDPSNSSFLGRGVWITKYAGAKGKFMTNEVDVEFANYIRRVVEKNNIPHQFGEMGKVEEGGGGTVAHQLAAFNMNVIDISLPTLSLHSPFELISKVDYHYTVETYKAFLKDSY